MTRVKTVRQWFDLKQRRGPRGGGVCGQVALPRPGEIVLITGPSGAGKSSLLRALRRRNSAARFIDVDEIALPNAPLVDCFPQLPLERLLGELGRVGLGEVWTYLRRPAQLSAGQRTRLRLLAGLLKAEKAQAQPAILLADEFAAVLDRVTAFIVARTLRKAVSAGGNVAAIVATSHEDLAIPLAADRVVRCDWGRCDTWTRCA